MNEAARARVCVHFNTRSGHGLDCRPSLEIGSTGLAYTVSCCCRNYRTIKTGESERARGREENRLCLDSFPAFASFFSSSSFFSPAAGCLLARGVARLVRAAARSGDDGGGVLLARLYPRNIQHLVTRNEQRREDDVFIPRNTCCWRGACGAAGQNIAGRGSL